MNRRGWLKTVGGILIAPAIVRAESIMRVTPFVPDVAATLSLRMSCHGDVMVQLWSGELLRAFERVSAFAGYRTVKIPIYGEMSWLAARTEVRVIEVSRPETSVVMQLR